MGLICLCDDQTTARVFIEPMHDSRPLLAADAGQLWKMMQQGVDQRVLAMARAWMNHQPGRLVDHNQIAVFI